jgi:hypothetical protein
MTLAEWAITVNRRHAATTCSRLAGLTSADVRCSRFDRIFQGSDHDNTSSSLPSYACRFGGASIGSAIDVNDPRQWQVKYTAKVLPATAYELHNLRRRELDLTSQLGFKEGPRLSASQTGRDRLDGRRGHPCLGGFDQDAAQPDDPMTANRG